jgi:hypothetical protein
MPVFRFKLEPLEAVGKGQFFVKNTSFDPESVFALKDVLTVLAGLGRDVQGGWWW